MIEILSLNRRYITKERIKKKKRRNKNIMKKKKKSIFLGTMIIMPYTLTITFYLFSLSFSYLYLVLEIFFFSFFHFLSINSLNEWNLIVTLFIQKKNIRFFLHQLNWIAYHKNKTDTQIPNPKHLHLLNFDSLLWDTNSKRKIEKNKNLKNPLHTN